MYSIVCEQTITLLDVSDKCNHAAGYKSHNYFHAAFLNCAASRFLGALVQLQLFNTSNGQKGVYFCEKRGLPS